jgi:hypothetical protein
MNDYYTDDNDSGWYEPDDRYQAEEDRPFYDDEEKDWKGSHDEDVDVDEWDEWEEIEDDDEEDEEDDEWE